MNQLNSKVAILLATYNGERYLQDQLDSLINQSFKDWVCYVHDDGSKDNTMSILRSYSKKYPKRFKILDYPGGQGAAGNFLSLIKFAANNCKENYFLFSDQDDIWLPNKIELEVNKMEEVYDDKTPILVYCDQKVVDQNLNIISNSSMNYSKKSHENDELHFLAFENNAPGCTMCVNRSLIRLSSKYTNVDNIVMHDWWVMLLAAVKGKIYYIDKSLMLYRQHGDNTLGAEQKSLLIKIKKYVSNFNSAMTNKSKHVKQCERQLIELNNVLQDRNQTLKKISNVCSRDSKLSKMKFFYKERYLSGNRIFTLFFV